MPICGIKANAPVIFADLPVPYPCRFTGCLAICVAATYVLILPIAYQRNITSQALAFSEKAFSWHP